MDTTGIEQGRENGRFVDRDLFRDVIGHFASGVTVITARHDDKDFGITASAVASLTLDPPMLLVCVNKKTGTRYAIAESGAFAVNILHEDQGELAARFARPDTDKYRGVDIDYGELGEPLLKDVLAHLECRVAQEVTAGTHSVFLAEVQNARAEQGTPLAYFRGAFGRFQEANDERVYRRIRQMVLERDFQIGQPLDVTGLAYQLDAPRQAIFYAMTRLVSEGLVSREAEATYVINPLDPTTYDQALDTRCALEIGAAGQAVGRVSDEELAELRRRMEATLSAGTDGGYVDLERYVEANSEFHEYTVALSKNPTLLDSYRRLSAEAIMLRALSGAAEVDHTLREEHSALVEDHVRLTEAFEAGDLEEARRVIHRHTEGGKRLGERAIESAGGRI